MSVIEAESGEQALQRAREQHIDAFLLDVRMGDMNGIEACRALRAMPAFRNTPVVFVTAIDQREVLQWALETGADDYIQKPLHAMVLRRRLANLLQKAASIREAELMSLSLQRYVSPRTEQMARGFTEMSQDLDPESVFEILSGHLAGQVDLVYQHGGYIDKYSDDGIMAVFDGSDMAAMACRCGLDLLDRARQSTGPAAIRIGIGIHVGNAMVGNLGSSDHLDYTVVGRTVNLAARLCGLANQSAVVSEAVRDAVAGKAFAFKSSPPVAIRGLREPMTVYELQRGPSPAM